MFSDQLIQNDILLLLKLIIAHLIADFILQRSTWIEQRKRKKYRSKYLYVHGFLVGLLAYIFSGYWSNLYIPIIFVITHILIDLWKSYQKTNVRNFFLDQLAHFVVIIFCWILYSNTEIDFQVLFLSLGSNKTFWIIILAYILIIWPSGYLISLITKKWSNDFKVSSSLQNSGKWIGWLERILILTFVLCKQFEAIGFLIAAKSILRFGDIQNPDNRKQAEFILIGTMLSFIVAILTGLFVIMIIN